MPRNDLQPTERNLCTCKIKQRLPAAAYSVLQGVNPTKQDVKILDTSVHLNANGMNNRTPPESQNSSVTSNTVSQSYETPLNEHTTYRQLIQPFLSRFFIRSEVNNKNNDMTGE